jgi:hypothetical protein
VRDQTLQHVQLAFDGHQGNLIDEDRHGVIGLAKAFKANMDLRIGRHQPCMPFSPMDRCASISTMVHAQELPLKQSGGVEMIDTDQNMASGVPLVSSLLQEHVDAVESSFSQGMRRERRRERMSGRAGKSLTTEITDGGRVGELTLV